VTIESPGHAGASTTVDIREGEPVRATLSLSPSAGGGPVQLEPVTDTGSPGKTSRVLFWTSLVATGAGVAAFTITGLQVRSIEKEQDESLTKFNYAANGIQHPNDACAEAEADGYTDLVDICKRGRRMATITNVLIGVTAATAVATAIFYWRGYLAPARAERADRRKKDRTRMVLSPEIYQNGAGLGALIQF